jgi:hypothetical protein
MRSSSESDFALLEAAVDLTQRRVNVSLGRVFEHVHARKAGSDDRVGLRLALLRLERDGLVQSDSDLNVEPTPDGQVAVELLRARRAHARRARPRPPRQERT